MVQDRKEPTLSTIKPERDEIATHQSRLNQRPSGGGGGGQRPPAGGQAAKGGSGAGIFLAVALAVLGLGVAGLSLWQLQGANQAMASAEDRLAELEARLNLTSTESDQSVTKIHEQLEWADSEIRKLWGVAYDTNRKNIAANQDKLAKLTKDIESAASTAKAARQTAEGQQSTLKTLQARVNEQQLVITQVSEDMAQLNQLEQQLAKLQEQLEAMESLPNRVKTNEEAIEAIDSFRRNINSEVQALKQRSTTP